MDGDGQDAGAVLVTATVHTGTHGADDHGLTISRCDGFEGERQVGRCRPGWRSRRRSPCGTSRPLPSGFAVLAGKLVEQVLARLPSTLMSTLRRPRWAMPMTASLAALLTGAANKLFEHGAPWHRFPFQGNAAPGTWHPGIFQPFGGGQALEEAGLLFEGIVPLPSMDSACLAASASPRWR